MSGATCRGSEHESAGAEWFGARGADIHFSLLTCTLENQLLDAAFI